MNSANQSFAMRRQRLSERVAQRGGGLVIVPTAPERARNRDTDYPYRHDSYFYYLSGFREPEAVLVMRVGEKTESFLFCRQKNEEREIWDGFRYGPEAARDTFGFDDAFAIEELNARLPELMGNQPAVWASLGHDAHWDQRVMDAVNTVRANTRSGLRAPQSFHDVRALLDEMRLIKDASEIATMRRAAQISRGAHTRAMQATRAGRYEYEIEAELLHEFRRHGSQYPAYTSIVASGANACVLHYISNEDVLRDGELLLIDAGCELDGYASDITRSFPVNGRFSGAQKDVYEVVLAAQDAALALCRPGTLYNDTHDAAVRVLTEGMVQLGLLTGEVDGLIESGAYRRFYMHRTGHWLGMDVHDAGEYKLDGEWRPLEAGMVVTIEPGCYIRPAEDVPQAFWNIGIRIEDDVLITADGHDILSAGTPKTVGEIEAVMAQGR